MTDEELPPLSDLAASLLAEEGKRPPVDAAIADGLLARVVASIGDGGGGGDGGASGGGGSHGGPVVESRGASAGKAAGGTFSASVLAVSVGGALAVGLVAGAGIHARMTEPVVRVVEVAASSAARHESSPPAPSTLAVDALPPASVSSVPRATHRSASSSADAHAAARDGDLARERAWIEQARMALARGDAAAALVALRGHEREHPRGRLTEEREALYVRALARAGRHDEAKARAAKFRARYPKSMLMGAVDEATSR